MALSAVRPLRRSGDRLVETLGGYAGVLQDPRGLGARGEHQRQEQIFGGDETIAGLLGDLFGIVQQARGFLGQINLARTTLDLGQFAQRRLRRRRAPASSRAAGGRDQSRCQTLLVIDQDLEQMFRGELLVAFAQRQICAD